MSEKTFHVTQEDLRKMESKESKFHGGTTPKDSDTSALKASASPPQDAFFFLTCS
jgi:hypothetical protein